MSFILLGILNSQAAGAVGVGVAGYFGGGSTDFTDGLTTIDKLDFSSESISTLPTGLSANTKRVAGFADSQVAAYYAGGRPSSTGSVTDKVDKLAFSDETRTTLATGLSSARRGPAGMADPAVAGYAGGGFGKVNTVDKFSFPSDSRSTLGTGLSEAKDEAAGMADPAVAGYIGGGRSSINTTTVDRFAFPSDSKSSLATGLSIGRTSVSSFQNPAVAGYIGLGQDGNIDKFQFPTETRSTFSAYGFPVVNAAGVSSWGSAGYIGGGRNNDSATILDTITKFEFPSDTSSTLGATLSGVRATHGGASNNA